MKNLVMCATFAIARRHLSCKQGAMSLFNHEISVFGKFSLNSKDHY